MAIAVKRKNRKIGQYSNFVNVPRPIQVGVESTIAANRLFLADPRGEIPERDLLDFFENHVEPIFWDWWHKRQSAAKARGDGQGLHHPIPKKSGENYMRHSIESDEKLLIAGD